ncbi:hypothetical protein KIN20_003303 [Parelaphostrongylus tenuis]|uniref:DH domain-containing protein n=1 Tax=Parelaphostrongylus tenuis TaxID=148309 RepID=A0AAD5MFF2_PARTN|nr:hypothetical protein KIN20_003303 [Parelaphostrongylus tenuis]
MLRINAELFELSTDGTKWVMIGNSMMYISVYRNEIDRVRIVAVSQTGRTVLDTTLGKDQKVEKISDCFVFWRDVSGRTLGVNTLTAKDAILFVTHTEPSGSSMMTMSQHNVIAQVALIATWNGEQFLKHNRKHEQTMISINPLNMVFHHNHGLINIDLLECFMTLTDKPNVLHLAYASQIYEFEFTGEANRFATKVLNMSSLLLSRTTCSDVAVTFLNRQQQKHQDKLLQLKSQRGVIAAMDTEKILLKEFAVQSRLCALANRPLPTFQDLHPDITEPVKQHILHESPLASIFLLYNNLYEFRMWRKSVDVRVNDLRALCSTSSRDAFTSCPSSSSASIFRVELPNGKTTVISHENANPEELLMKICTKLAVEPDQFELNRIDSGVWKLRVRDEYEVHKRHAKLGLTIYAYNDNGIIKAEVRGMTSYAPEGADIGDQVVSVDGKLISKVSSAADVERMLREGRIIRLRKTRGPLKFDSQSIKNVSHEIQRPLKSMPLSELASSQIKSEEKLLRSIEELVQTEKKYVEDLKEMIDRYLSIPSVREIMESALRLQKMQTSFLDALEEAVGDIGSRDLSSRPLVRDAIIRVCALFVNRCGDFRIYAEYAAAYLRLLQELTSRKDLLASLEAANSSKEQHSSYESRMIKPVQRVVQYPLLLRAIQSCCDQDSLQAKQVEIALQKMQTLAEYVNEMQRIHEEYAPHIAIIRKQNELLFKEKGLRIDIRDLLIFAHVQWLNTEKSLLEYVIFVFQTIVLLLPRNIRRDCKMKWMRALPINEVQVEDDRPDEPSFIIVHSKDSDKSSNDTTYHLTCCQVPLKQQLVRSIKRARSNFCRETRRPLSGSSQSDGGYGSDPVKDRKSS